jgi:hypothetical protein
VSHNLHRRMRNRSQNPDEPLDIITRWAWRPQGLFSSIVEIEGGAIPELIRQHLKHSRLPVIGPDSELYQSGKRVAEYLAQIFPTPPPLELGGTSPIIGEITGIQSFSSRTSKDPNQNHINCYVEYSNGLKLDMGQTFRLEELPEFVQVLIKNIHQETNVKIREWFWLQYGQGEMNPQKWKAEKLEVFISYRSTKTSFALDLFHALGSFENSSAFLPRIDRMDLQAGNWLDQLMLLIHRCPVFIPILTMDYLTGPFSRPELDQALRQVFSQPGKRIVPILIEGSPKDYENHFIGGFQMVVALDGLSSDLVKKIAYMCLGISQNPYG